MWDWPTEWENGISKVIPESDMVKPELLDSAIVKYWWLWINFHQSFEKCSILTHVALHRYIY